MGLCKCLHSPICCDKVSSTAANKLSQQWAVRLSTAHRLEICRALYLVPSRNKWGLVPIIVAIISKKYYLCRDITDSVILSQAKDLLGSTYVHPLADLEMLHCCSA